MPAGESSPLNRADIPHRDSADLINKTERFRHCIITTMNPPGQEVPAIHHYLLKTSHFQTLHIPHLTSHLLTPTLPPPSYITVKLM